MQVIPRMQISRQTDERGPLQPDRSRDGNPPRALSRWTSDHPRLVPGSFKEDPRAESLPLGLTLTPDLRVLSAFWTWSLVALRAGPAASGTRHRLL